VADVNNAILEWLHSQQDWLQYAAELLLSDGNISDDQLDELVAYLKTPEGQKITAHRKFEGLTINSSAVGALRLTEIGDISGIENLAPRRPLNFGDGNLCVIYGHNGSGKSGYTRILSKVCGKPRSPELQPNVFEAPPAARQCRVAYLINGVARQAEWIANSGPIDDLGSVDIFDTDTATAYLTEEKSVTYTPSAIALFETLVRICSRVRDKLQNEQDRLINALPQLPTDYVATSAGTAYRGLRVDLPETTIQSLVRWNPEDEKALEALDARLKAADPARAARLKRNTKQQVDQLTTKLKAMVTAFGKDQLDTIRQARADAFNKRRIATEAANVKSAELDGVGSDTWRSLWEAARAYSQTAYPDQQYPVTDDALCVLCHQELGHQAKERLQEFEAFVQGHLESEAKTAEATYTQLLSALPTALSEEQVTTMCHASGLAESLLATQIAEAYRQTGAMRTTLLDHEQDKSIDPIDPPMQILEDLIGLAQALEHEATQYDEDSKSFDREQAMKQMLDFEARKWTSQQNAAISAEIDRLKQFACYEDWKRLANSQGISRKAGEISEQVITQSFVDRFNGELKALGAVRVRVELSRTRTERGRALHKLRLRGARDSRARLEAVLSEGERRIVALAALLADVADQPNSSPFVFDDPISSLDHDYEWHVAVRLAQLAQTRQVLVFTHRLSLYGAMEDAAKKIGDDWKTRNLHQHCIEAYLGTAGHPIDQAVWNANTKKANNILISRLDGAKKAGEAGGGEAYRALAQGICSDFRKLLERTVEDDLLNQVVRRHRRSVTTDNRLTPLPLIEPSDCQFIDELMTKYSCYEHSQSLETPVFIPDEQELQKDLEDLKRWREDFRGRPRKITGA